MLQPPPLTAQVIWLGEANSAAADVLGRVGWPITEWRSHDAAGATAAGPTGLISEASVSPEPLAHTPTDPPPGVLIHPGSIDPDVADRCAWRRDVSLASWSSLAGLTEMALAQSLRCLTEEYRHERFAQRAILDAVGRVVSRMLHEQNNHLNAIYGSLGMLEALLTPSDPGHEWVRSAFTAATAAAASARRARVWSRDFSSRPAARPLGETLSDALPVIRALAGQQTALELHLRGPDRVISAPPGALERALGHLALDATRFDPPAPWLRITVDGQPSSVGPCVELDQPWTPPRGRPGLAAAVRLLHPFGGQLDRVTLQDGIHSVRLLLP